MLSLPEEINRGKAEKLSRFFLFCVYGIKPVPKSKTLDRYRWMEVVCSPLMVGISLAIFLISSGSVNTFG